MDAATRELFEESSHIGGMVTPDSVDGLISQERWQQPWKKVKEDTSSSQSGLHFGHYIAGTDCDYISQFHALQVLLALMKGIALERWSKGLSVLLEKMFGVQLVSKLRAILLMEANFNAMNNEVYSVWMLDNARQYKLIREEIFSEQNRKIVLPTMVVSQKRCFMILPARRALRLQSPPLTPQTVTIGLRTPWHLSCSNPLESKARQSRLCWK